MSALNRLRLPGGSGLTRAVQYDRPATKYPSLLMPCPPPCGRVNDRAVVTRVPKPRATMFTGWTCSWLEVADGSNERLNALARQLNTEFANAQAAFP
jgi:hypothetical protein